MTYTSRAKRQRQSSLRGAPKTTHTIHTFSVTAHAMQQLQRHHSVRPFSCLQKSSLSQYHQSAHPNHMHPFTKAATNRRHQQSETYQITTLSTQTLSQNYRSLAQRNGNTAANNKHQQHEPRQRLQAQNNTLSTTTVQLATARSVTAPGGHELPLWRSVIARHT